MKCPNCLTHQLVIIEIRVGRELFKMHSCSYCDRRWWEGIDGIVPLNSVLDLAAAS